MMKKKEVAPYGGAWINTRLTFSRQFSLLRGNFLHSYVVPWQIECLRFSKYGLTTVPKGVIISLGGK